MPDRFLEAIAQARGRFTPGERAILFGMVQLLKGARAEMADLTQLEAAVADLQAEEADVETQNARILAVSGHAATALDALVAELKNAGTTGDPQAAIDAAAGQIAGVSAALKGVAAADTAGADTLEQTVDADAPQPDATPAQPATPPAEAPAP